MRKATESRNVRREWVVNLTREFANKLGKEPGEVKDLEVSVSCIDAILYLNSEMKSNNDLMDVKNHPIYMFNLFGGMDHISDTATTIMLQHQERIDGSGYPEGLKKEDIHPLSKIMAVIGEYMHLKKDGKSKEESLKALKGQLGVSKFDDGVLSEFIDFAKIREDF